MDFSLQPVVTGVCRYTNRLLGLSKTINHSIRHNADTMHVTSIPKKTDGGKSIEFPKVQTVIIGTKVCGSTMKVILEMFPNVEHLIFKVSPTNVLRYLPESVRSIGGTFHRKRNMGPFPKFLESLVVNVDDRTNLSLLPKRTNTRVIQSINGYTIDCLTLPTNTFSISIFALDSDISRSKVTSLTCDKVHDISFIPRRIVSLECWFDTDVDLSSFTSLEFLRCNRVNSDTLPGSLHSLFLTEHHSAMNLSSTELKSLRCIEISKGWSLPISLISLECHTLMYVHEMPNLKRLSFIKGHNSLKLNTLKSLAFLKMWRYLTLDIAYTLPKSLYELHVRCIGCSRLPLPNLKYLKVYIYTVQLVGLKIINGHEFDFDTQCVISLPDQSSSDRFSLKIKETTALKSFKKS